MREELQSLKELIDPKALRTKDLRKGTLLLREPKNEGTTKQSQVTLLAVPEETVVFTLDLPNCRMSNYLPPTSGGWNRGCDYVIATHDGKEGWLLICEMKSSNPQGFVPQLKSGDGYASYLDALMQHFKTGRLSGYQRRHVLFHQPHPLRKRELRMQFSVEQKDKIKLVKVDRNVLRIDDLFIQTQ